MYQKNFDQWNLIKQQINSENRSVRIRAGDVCWVFVGINVGSEIDGKGESFLRPALILNVIGHDLVLIIPITSNKKGCRVTLHLKFKTASAFCASTSSK